MLDFTLRELAISAAIVFILSFWVIDREILQTIVALLREFR